MKKLLPAALLLSFCGLAILAQEAAAKNGCVRR
jgi:hypothetical protein